MKKKYIKEFEKANDKKEFIKILMLEGILKETARRTYDKYKVYFKKQIIPSIPSIKIIDDLDFIEPNRFKKLMLEDMIRYKKPITRLFLKKYGFIDEEINWVIKNGKI